ncbi:MAG: RNA polymerase sigma factor RpoE [Succinivibrionaceae bacterium]|nr:RNA polymerase sigma factor RpoE [Succinivibrionaceae bacterium]
MLSADVNNEAAQDAAIVRRVQRGDKDAYNLLVIKYQHRIIEVAGKFVGERSDALDIAQEAFIKAYRSIGGFRGESSFYTWLYRIAVNVAKTFLESNSRRRSDLDVDAPETEAQDTGGALRSDETPEGVIESEELRQVIAQALRELPDDLRQAITLREIEGMSYDDIAVIMKTPIGTVRSRIFRARQFIEERMSRLGG